MASSSSSRVAHVIRVGGGPLPVGGPMLLPPLEYDDDTQEFSSVAPRLSITEEVHEAMRTNSVHHLILDCLQPLKGRTAKFNKVTAEQQGFQRKAWVSDITYQRERGFLFWFKTDPQSSSEVDQCALANQWFKQYQQERNTAKNSTLPNAWITILIKTHEQHDVWIPLVYILNQAVRNLETTQVIQWLTVMRQQGGPDVPVTVNAAGIISSPHSIKETSKSYVLETLGALISHEGSPRPRIFQKNQRNTYTKKPLPYVSSSSDQAPQKRKRSRRRKNDSDSEEDDPKQAKSSISLPVLGFCPPSRGAIQHPSSTFSVPLTTELPPLDFDQLDTAPQDLSLPEITNQGMQDFSLVSFSNNTMHTNVHMHPLGEEWSEFYTDLLNPGGHLPLNLFPEPETDFL